MKNPIIILAIITVFGIGTYTLSQNSSKSDSMMKKDGATIQEDKQGSMDKSESSEKEAMEKKEGEAMKKTDDKKMADSRYVEYSKAALEKAVRDRRVLFFYASWCPTCRPADANFKENISKIPEDI